jgi:hypothetical protein
MPLSAETHALHLKGTDHIWIEAHGLAQVGHRTFTFSDRFKTLAERWVAFKRPR